jgi:hypothetical protein
MQARVMDQKKTRVVLFFVAIAAVGGAVLAGFLFSQNSGATPETQTDQSIQVESDNAESPTPEEPESDAIEWVEGMDPLDLLTEEELNSLLNAGSEQDAENNGNRGSVTPSPRSSSENNNYGEGLPTVDDYPSAGDSSSTTAPDCYGQYEAACKVGFVAPSIEYVGYLSCSKSEDGTVRLQGLVRLVGGNYKDWVWNTATHNGMGIVSSRVSEFPYVLSWYATATFYSMDSRYTGVIGQASGSGRELLDESQLDSSCRF